MAATYFLQPVSYGFYKMKSLLISVILVALYNCADAQIGIPQIITLLDSVNDTTNTMASILPLMANSLRNQEANQNQTAILLSQLANTQIQIASTQAEMARTLNQVVLILQGEMLSIKYNTTIYKKNGQLFLLKSRHFIYCDAYSFRYE